MSATERETGARQLARSIARQAFTRAAGTPVSEGNQIRLLIDGAENYPAWLAAIRGARRDVRLENYIIHDDDVGRAFADALIARASDGVRVRVMYDWLGCLRTPRAFWRRLRAGGVEVRCHNPPRWDAPLAWFSRDHRKTLSVDGEVGFVAGLCIGQMWLGQTDKKIGPWRDTGIELRGPAVAHLADAFSSLWGDPPTPPPDGPPGGDAPTAGDVALRVVAGVPATADLLRVDQLVAALATRRLWLSDAYFVGNASYTQALCAAARDGVDVRLLIPGSSDLPALRLLTRAGFLPLLRAGVRVFEWNGTMFHAKTSVADARWARVGSTNLNIASWLGNYEMDVVVEDEGFGRQMEARYLVDLASATELVLDHWDKLCAPDPGPVAARSGGSAGRAATGALRIANAVGAAVSERRVVEPAEGRIALSAGLALAALAALFGVFPKLLAYPLVVVLAWLGLALVSRGIRLLRARAVAPDGR
jgi:cardiolipin synthase